MSEKATSLGTEPGVLAVLTSWLLDMGHVCNRQDGFKCTIFEQTRFNVRLCWDQHTF